MLKNRAFSELKKQRCGCGTTESNVLCTTDTCNWFINSPIHFNCFLVYAHYIQDIPHTLQEVAALMNISHTTVKQLESHALRKIRENLDKKEATSTSLFSFKDTVD